jgi:hypothetical protein
LSGRSTELKFDNIPNLSRFEYNPVDRLKVYEKIFIGENVGTKTNWSIRNFVQEVYNQQTSNNVHNLQSVHIEDIDWTNVDAEMVTWLSERPTCELYGRIGIAEGTNEYQTAVTWDLKNKFIKKFGDIDTGNGDLTLEYRKRNFEASTAKIKGNFFVDDYIVRDKGYNDVETFDFSVTPESTYMNTQTKIQFSLEGGNTSAYSMSADGKLSVNVYQLSDKQNFATVKAAVTQYENGSYVTEDVKRTIELWLRPAQLGDVVYYDGTYGLVDDYDDGGKTPVGICCYVAPKYTDTTSEHNRGDIVEELFDPNDVMQRLMVSLDYVYPAEVFETTSRGFVWGIRTWNNSDKEDLFTVNETGSKTEVKKNGKDLALIDDVVDYKKSGLLDGTNTVSDNSFRENSYLASFNDNFALISADCIAGDGISYQESEAYKNRRTMKSNKNWVNEASDYYKKYIVGEHMVNSGYANTLKIISHRNSIIRGDGSSNIDNFKDSNGVPINISLYKPSLAEADEVVSSLCQCMIQVDTYFRDVMKDAYPKKWEQLLFPAVSAAYEFQPSIRKTESLNERFKGHNWFLPPGNILCRLYWYSILGGEQNIFKKSTDKGFMKQINITSFHASSVVHMEHVDNALNFYNGILTGETKSNTQLVRPICAF